MSIETTPEVTPSEADQLSAGFNDEPIKEAPQETVEETQPEPEVKQEEVVEEVKPETVSITSEQWNALQSRLAEIDSIKAETARRVDQALGKYGELNRTLQQMQQKPAGGVDMSRVKFERLAADYPEFAKLIQEDLVSSFVPVQEKAATLDPAELEQRFQSKLNEEIEKLALKSEIRDLTRRHRDWETVVRSNEFQQWGASLPSDKWEALRSSNDADEISGGLDEYKAHIAALQAAQTAAAKPTEQRKVASKRLEAAITPTGTASSPVTLSERDLFLQGFKSP